MSVIKKDKFDIMLSHSLQEHSEPVSDGFTERISRQIRETEQQKILARVIMQERLALAGCIILGVMLVFSLVVFPDIVVDFKELVETSIRKATQSIDTTQYIWCLYVVFTGIFGFAVYGFVDLLVGDGRR
jgi:hypothetical protein